MDTSHIDFEDSQRGGIECVIPPHCTFDRLGDAFIEWLTPTRRFFIAVAIVGATQVLSAVLPSLAP